MIKLTEEDMISMVKAMEADKMLWKKYYEEVDNYEFNSHSQMFCFLIAIFKHLRETINFNNYDIRQKECFEFYEFCRRIDFEIMLSYCIENAKMQLEPVHFFYCEYLFLNYKVLNYAEIIKTSKNLELLFPDDPNARFYRLIYLFDNLDTLTTNYSYNKSFFVQEFNNFINNCNKDSLIVNPILYSIKLDQMLDFINSNNSEYSINKIALSDEQSFYIKERLMLNHLAGIEDKNSYLEFQNIECNDLRLNSLVESLIADYFYTRTRFYNHKNSADKKRELLSIVNDVFALYDKVAYILYKMFEVSEIKEHRVYFRPDFFEKSTIKKQYLLLDSTNPYIKTLYLYSYIYSRSSDELIGQYKYSIGNWNYNGIRNTYEHKSTSLIKDIRPSSVNTLFQEARSTILTLIKLINFEKC